jgi:hypothetical protein
MRSSQAKRSCSCSATTEIVRIASTRDSSTCITFEQRLTMFYPVTPCSIFLILFYSLLLSCTEHLLLHLSTCDAIPNTRVPLPPPPPSLPPRTPRRYTIEDMGVDVFRAEVEKRGGFKFGAPRPFKFTSNIDRFGWNQCADGLFAYGMFVEHGRVRNEGSYELMTGLEAIAKVTQHNDESSRRITFNIARLHSRSRAHVPTTPH